MFCFPYMQQGICPSKSDVICSPSLGHGGVFGAGWWAGLSAYVDSAQEFTSCGLLSCADGRHEVQGQAFIR